MMNDCESDESILMQLTIYNSKDRLIIVGATIKKQHESPKSKNFTLKLNIRFCENSKSEINLPAWTRIELHSVT